MRESLAEWVDRDCFAGLKVSLESPIQRFKPL
jgi:hypothetical protein